MRLKLHDDLRCGTASWGGAGGSPADREWQHAHRRWRDRGYLPHFDASGVFQMITYRLADALPDQLSRQRAPAASNQGERRKWLEKCLDAGHGSCLLRRPEIATAIIANWMRFDGVRYELLAWVVMPNHVHVLIEVLPGHPLPRVVQGWKSFSAKAIGHVTGTQGRVWQPDYWDRVIRNEAHFAGAVDYILENPAKAGLVCNAEDWLWSGTRLPDGSPTPTDEFQLRGLREQRASRPRPQKA